MESVWRTHEERKAEAAARVARLDRRNTEVASILSAVVAERRLGHAATCPTASSETTTVDVSGALFTLPQLVLVAGEVHCDAADLVRDLGLADYERSRPEPSYKSRYKPMPPPDRLPAEVVGSRAPSAVMRRFGHALRTFRRATVLRPGHLVARDAGITYGALLEIETGKGAGRLPRLVHVADACETAFADLLSRAGL